MDLVIFIYPDFTNCILLEEGTVGVSFCRRKGQRWSMRAIRTPLCLQVKPSCFLNEFWCSTHREPFIICAIIAFLLWQGPYLMLELIYFSGILDWSMTFKLKSSKPRSFTAGFFLSIGMCPPKHQFALYSSFNSLLHINSSSIVFIAHDVSNKKTFR